MINTILDTTGKIREYINSQKVKGHLNLRFLKLRKLRMTLYNLHPVKDVVWRAVGCAKLEEQSTFIMYMGDWENNHKKE